MPISAVFKIKPRTAVGASLGKLETSWLEVHVDVDTTSVTKSPTTEATQAQSATSKSKARWADGGLAEPLLTVLVWRHQPTQHGAGRDNRKTERVCQTHPVSPRLFAPGHLQTRPSDLIYHPTGWREDAKRMVK